MLLITIDTLRQDALGTYGADTPTPAIDELARAGTRFDDAVAPAPITLPSHTSILSGLDPSRHGVRENSGFRVPGEIELLPEILAARGYATGAFVGAFPLDSQFGLDQGFDTYDDRYDGTSFSELQIVERRAADVVLPARRWIRRQDGPWFAWVHVYDPHAPYDPVEPWATEYADNPYAGEVAATDAALAPLLRDALSRGALVILTSDHGEGLGDHGELRHGVFAYDSTLRVPLIVAWPDVLPAGRAVDGRVGLVDILPTVCELVGADCGDRDGRSLAPALRGGSVPAARDLYFETMLPYLTRGWSTLRGVYHEDWKYIDAPIPELYRTSVDPGEEDNLAERESQQRERMRGRLAEHLGLAGTFDAGAGPESEETLERLSALGYLGGTRSSSRLPDPSEFEPADDPKNLIGLDQRMQEAVALASEGEPDRAAGVFRTILDERPDFIAAHLLLAGVEAGRGNLEVAIDQLDRALRAGAQSPELLTRLGGYLRDAGRFDESAQVLEEALREDPENVATINLMAAVEGARGRFAEAAELIDLGISIDPSHAPLYANRGTLALSQGGLEEARQQFERALEQDPRLADAHNGLGVIAAQQGRLDEAIDSWRTAIAIDAGLHDARYNLALTLLRLERRAEAETVVAEFVAMAPPDRYGREIEQMRALLAQLRR